MKKNLEYINTNVECGHKLKKKTLKIICFIILTIYQKTEYFVGVLTNRFWEKKWKYIKIFF